jgi:demethylmenaquinone methyltransferase / 2-methoxy-6-polyprenyl-1,4-benzoquinol methylase
MFRDHIVSKFVSSGLHDKSCPARLAFAVPTRQGHPRSPASDLPLTRPGTKINTWIDHSKTRFVMHHRFELRALVETMSQTAADSSSAKRDSARSSACGEQAGIDKSDQRVRRMFASIARRYDLLNHLLSLNIDRSWRRFTTARVPPQAGVPVLDCCTGTADLALAYDRAAKGLTPIIGTDFCREMLVLGNSKVRKNKAVGRVLLIEGDAHRLPAPSDTFGVVSVAFGLRNIRDTVRGVDEMIRTALPGGKVAILEFSRPRGWFLGRIYLAFFRHVLPRLGQVIAPNQDQAYHYLPRSVLSFPDGQQMLNLLGSRGLIELRMYPLTLGVATLYVGTKPSTSGASPDREST